ncbi:serine/threonine kinase [Sporobolomyces koalae]|uniref:serine/threonine kinase n=1 Tax=Sporobolomyces koalae TaxID=500713 RepID=UPI0031820300
MPATRVRKRQKTDPKTATTATATTRFYQPRTQYDDTYETESSTSSTSTFEPDPEEDEARDPRRIRSAGSRLRSTSLTRKRTNPNTYRSSPYRPRKLVPRARDPSRPDRATAATTRFDHSTRLHSGPSSSSRPLSPLVANVTSTNYRVSHSKKAMPVAHKRSRDPSVVRVTRRASGVVAGTAAPHSATNTPNPKRKRSSVIPAGSDSSDEETDQTRPRSLGRSMLGQQQRQQPEASDESEQDEMNEAQSTETDEERAESPGNGKSAFSELLDDASKLREWSATKLRSLLKSELVDLFLSLPSSSTSHPDTAAMTKDVLISAIVSARKPPSPSRLRHTSSSNEDDSTDASPQPRTSLEPSPEDDDNHPRTKARTLKLRRSGGRTRSHPLTPPHTSGEEDHPVQDEAGESMVVTEGEEDESESTMPARITRRASQVEMPPPPPPGLARQAQPLRNATRTHTTGDEPTTKLAPKGARRLNQIIREEEAEPTPRFVSPVAHRTRRGQRPPSASDAAPSRTIIANAQGSPARPERVAKRKAVAKIKGKERADDDHDEDPAEDEMQLDEFEDEVVSHDDSEEEEEETAATRDASDNHRRRRSMRKTVVRQVETPPSDADEESGGEEVVELKSHLRAAGRGGKNGKVVRLRNLEDDEPELGIQDEEDEDMEADYEEEEEQDDDEVDLIHATSKSLLRCRKDDLVRLCEERDLRNDGRTKKELVDALLQWRDQENYASSQDSDASTSSTVSNASTETARGATKTARLERASHASRRTSKDTPLLMRAEHPASPDKPRTPKNSKEREQQEDVNALDLESLQLQDKEIPPEKLTKLELVGSGGFKDVYKGTYRRRTIAICDIRGHLTDMDIKELGLLRDLRHENIVQFIGVSIPKQPSAVPVMIVTELCANGDLFDYIRGVEAPPLRGILDIMLGIAKGIEYLHTRTPSIIHRDIKSSNVLITAHGVAKIADFGLARIKTSTKSMIRSLVGTVNWQAPELWHPHPRYNEKVDVYSVGLVMWEMLQWHQPVKRYPFEGMNEHAIYADVGQRQLRPSTAGLHRRWGGEIIDLLSQMWDQDYSKRPSMVQVVHRLKQLSALEKVKSKA